MDQSRSELIDELTKDYNCLYRGPDKGWYQYNIINTPSCSLPVCVTSVICRKRTRGAVELNVSCRATASGSCPTLPLDCIKDRSVEIFHGSTQTGEHIDGKAKAAQ